MSRYILPVFCQTILVVAGCARASNVSNLYQASNHVPEVATAAGGTIPFPLTSVGNDGAVRLKSDNRRSDAATVTPQASNNATFLRVSTASSPSLITSYILNPGGNQTAIASGGTLPFPDTVAGQTASAAFVISNRGTAAGSLQAVSIAGSAFGTSGVPLLPAQITPNTEVRFTVVFSPKTRDEMSGSLSVTLDNTEVTVMLQGRGMAASFSYAVISQSGSATVNPNDTVTFPSTVLGGNSALMVQIQNNGNAAGTINSISVVGPDFHASEMPPLPVTVIPGAIVTFKLTFSPGATGDSTGKLLIDAVILNLRGIGQGATLGYYFRQGGVSTPLGANGIAIFPNTTVGETAQAYLDIKNTGNESGTIRSVTVSGPPFSTPNMVALPVTIQAGDMASIAISFTPKIEGPLTGTLLIDTQSIALRGTGDRPQALPSFQYSGISDSAEPLQQPAMGISLDRTYPYELTGMLTLAFVSGSFGDDPAIQFSSGGRSVPFTIPANTTSAIFGAGATHIQFQTGTVAGAITFRATFAVGAVDISPQPPFTRSVAIGASAPVIRSVQLGATTGSSFELLITGYSTARSVSTINMQFTPSTGANLQTTTLRIDAASAFASWYDSAASQTVGSQFTATVTIQASGNITAVQGVSVVLSNNQGQSQPISLNLR